MEKPSRRNYHSPSPCSNRIRNISGFSDLVEEFFCTSPTDLTNLAADFADAFDDLPSDSSEIFEEFLKFNEDQEVPIIKSARERIREEFEQNDLELASSVTQKKKIETEVFTPPRPVKTNMKLDVQSPRHIPLSPPSSPACNRQRDHSSEEELEEDIKPICPKANVKPREKTERTKVYNVLVTPPINVNGRRICTVPTCDGEVRPQKCGGNKHRWRCVSKLCRKWYGWVKSSDQLPKNLGQLGRTSLLYGNTDKEKADKPKRKYTRTSETRKAVEAILAEEGVEPLLGDTLTKKKRAPKRKAPMVKQPDAECPKREPSPLTEREKKWKPSQMEKRTRWWINEKNRRANSPARELEATMADAAAAFRLIAISFRAAAFTRADEPGSINGALDHMMDSLMGCMGPMLSLLSKLPNMHPAEGVVKQVWNASAVHIPTFNS